MADKPREQGAPAALRDFPDFQGDGAGPRIAQGAAARDLLFSTALALVAGWQRRVHIPGFMAVLPSPSSLSPLSLYKTLANPSTTS